MWPFTRRTVQTDAELESALRHEEARADVFARLHMALEGVDDVRARLDRLQATVDHYRSETGTLKQELTRLERVETKAAGAEARIIQHVEQNEARLQNVLTRLNSLSQLGVGGRPSSQRRQRDELAEELLALTGGDEQRARDFLAQTRAAVAQANQTPAEPAADKPNGRPKLDDGGDSAVMGFR